MKFASSLRKGKRRILITDIEKIKSFVIGGYIHTQF
jgi:hypothetical protein